MLGLYTPGARSSLVRIPLSRYLSLKPNFSKFKKIEQPPGNIVGTVNDPYKHPLVSNYEGGYHWTYERALAISLVPLTMAPFVAGVEIPVADFLFSITLLFHCHTGLKSCIIDYIPERVYGIWHKIASKLLTLGTSLGIYGIYLLETENNGVFDLVKSIWVQ